MHFKHWIVVGLYLSSCIVSAYNYEFKVTVPDSLVVTLGETVVLPCSFTVGKSWQPEDIVITWQRGLEVVHSFYYSRDQLKRQSSHYANRTRLYHSEMQKGNASLRLKDVSLEDVGDYICSVSSQLGSEKKSFPLKVAALYSEPVLQFSARPGSVKLVLTSEGFPAPTLHWWQGHEDITNSTETQLTRDTHTGLYVVSSTLTLKGSSNATLTVILRNEDLLQEIRRNISLLSEYEDESPIASQRCPRMREYILIPLMVFMLLTVIVLFYLYTPCRQKIWRQDQTKEIIRKAEKCKQQELCCFHVKHEIV